MIKEDGEIIMNKDDGEIIMNNEEYGDLSMLNGHNIHVQPSIVSFWNFTLLISFPLCIKDRAAYPSALSTLGLASLLGKWVPHLTISVLNQLGTIV